MHSEICANACGNLCICSLLTEISKAARKCERGERPLSAPSKNPIEHAPASCDNEWHFSHVKHELGKPVFVWSWKMPNVAVLYYGLAMIPAVNKPGMMCNRCITKVTKNWYFKTRLVSSKIMDDSTSKNLLWVGRGLSSLSHFLAAWETSVSREMYMYIYM